MAHKTVVYRFETESCGRKVSPRHMLGTLEAIAGLGAIALLDTRREVDPRTLEAGFLFESFNASEPARGLDSASRRIHVDADHL